MIKRFIFSTHRILGTLLSLLFLMWFLSGFVMLYKGFPYIPFATKYLRMEPLSSSAEDLSVIDSLINVYTKQKDTRLISLNMDYGQIKLTVTNEQASQLAYPVSPPSTPTFHQIKQKALNWNNTPIIKTDTLTELEQWIPWSNYRKEMPIYKFQFADGTFLYISGVTGEALQLASQSDRIWAWLGAIPHWIYFTQLRQNALTWRWTVGILAGIGCIVCLSGLFVGVRSLWMARRSKRKRISPYKKSAYKVHHIMGYTFGIFVFTFIFSGMMSVSPVPEKIVKVHRPELTQFARQESPLHQTTFSAHYSQILKRYPHEVKEIRWKNFADIPIYQAIIGDKELFFDASEATIRPLLVSEEQVNNLIKQWHSKPYRVEKIYRYDNYYGRPGRLEEYPLPVYKVSVEDADNSLYYINPKNGRVQYFNSNTKARHWSYQVLHKFSTGFFTEHNTLRLILMWIVLLGGTALSGSGVWLSILYIRRKLNRKRHK